MLCLLYQETNTHQNITVFKVAQVTFAKLSIFINFTGVWNTFSLSILVSNPLTNLCHTVLDTGAGALFPRRHCAKERHVNLVWKSSSATVLQSREQGSKEAGFVAGRELLLRWWKIKKGLKTIVSGRLRGQKGAEAQGRNAVCFILLCTTRYRNMLLQGTKDWGKMQMPQPKIQLV